MEASNLITAGLLFIVIIVAGTSWFCWHLHQDAHRYAIGTRKALSRLASKLHKAIDMPCTSTDMGPIEMALGTALNHFEDIIGKIKDDTARARLELSFMVVRGMLPDLSIRVCVDDTVFCFYEGGYNQQAVMKSLTDFNVMLVKIKRS